MPGTVLVQTLADLNSELAVFAPTNAAFGQLAADLGFSGDPADSGVATQFIVGALPATKIRDVILYRVSVSTQTTQQIGCASTVATLLGPTITNEGPKLIDNEPDLINPSLIATDILADNGMIHVIGRVLLPATLLQSEGSGDVGFIIADDNSNLIRMGRDKIDLTDVGFADYHDLESHIHAGSFRTTFDPGDSDAITLKCPSWGDVSKYDFVH